MSDDLRLLEMSLALDYGPEKIFCTARTTHPKTGYTVSKCSMHKGHVDQAGNPNAHVDVHTGSRWKDRP